MSDTLHCPHCAVALEPKSKKHGLVWKCGYCCGQSVGVGLAKTIAKSAEVLGLWTKLRTTGRKGSVPCPACKSVMRHIRVPQKLGGFELDACLPCFLMWFDKGEFESLPLEDPRLLPPIDKADLRAYRSILSHPVPHALGVKPSYVLLYRLLRLLRGF